MTDRGAPSPTARGEAVVRALGRAPVKGTRWQWLDRVALDSGGVDGDRAWALVDDRLRCLRTVAHPGLAGLDAPVDDLLARAGADGEAATVTYWGRPVAAELFDLPWCGPGSAVARLVGEPVRLARARRRPGFLWHWPVSLLLLGDLDALDGVLPPGAGDDLARFRPNLVIDDTATPLPLAPGTVLRIGDVELVCRERLVRCPVVDHDPSEPVRVARVFRSLPDGLLGWGCEVLVAGDVSCGTSVHIT